MTREAVPWPPALAGTPAVAVIEQAIARRRLSHSLLLAGDDPERLAGAALALADRILRLGAAAGPGFPPDKHPDCFQLRPAGRSRAITADAIRELVGAVNVSASAGSHKVAILHDADRMNPQAANVLLKTLEEPPSGTTLVLLTARPHALLPTIRSRVLHFRFSGMRPELPLPAWPAWIGDYRAWLARVSRGVAAGKDTAEVMMGLYGLVARFSLMLDAGSSAEFARRKADLPEELAKDEVEAIEAEIAVGLRQRMFAGIAEATEAHYRAHLELGESSVGHMLAAANESLEKASGLLRLNVTETVALEDFLLASLRIWSRR